MQVVEDFQVVHGVSTGILIGDSGIKPVWEQTFHTGHCRSNGHAYLAFMVKGLTGEGPGARVEINDQFVGRIERYTGGNQHQWYMQTLNIPGEVLNNGNNELEIHAASNESNTDQLDDFRLKNIFCHFQQSA